MTMSNKHNAPWLSAFDALGDELARVAQADAATPPRRRRWMVALAALSLVGTPTALAAGGAFDGGADTVSIEVPGEDVKVNGEQIDCPEDGGAFVQELGSNPCEAFTIEVPPPASKDSGAADSDQRDSGEPDGASSAPASTPAGTKTSDDDESVRVPAPGSLEALQSDPDGRQPPSPPGVAPRRDPLNPDQRKPPQRAP